MRRESSSSSSIDIHRRRRRYSISSPSQFDSRVGAFQWMRRFSSLKVTSKHGFPRENASSQTSQLVSELNRGTFGRTYLIRDSNDGKFYLLKQIDRSLPDRFRPYLLQEQSLFSCLKSNLILSLIDSYFDPNHQCYSMKFEYCTGLTLYHLLRRLRWFEESAVAFYAAQIVLALEYLHDLKIIYVGERNLKLETILLTEHGYIKLSDLAFAKQLSSDSTRTSTIIGVPDTIPPEMLLGRPYSYSVDWWQLGIAMFEMFTSRPPFFAQSMVQTHRNVLCQDHLQFPLHVSSSARRICRHFLQRDVHRRLGCSFASLDAKEVKDSHWFKDQIDWGSIIEQTYPAPYLFKAHWFAQRTERSHELKRKIDRF